MVDRNLFTSDKPIFTASDDSFKRWPFARRVSQTITQRTSEDSLVLGIYGPWGDGKTSVLNFIDAELSSQDNIVVVRFNPWLFRDETTLLKSFFETLAETLGRKLPTRKQELGEKLRKYGGILSVASVSLFGLAISPGQAVKELGDQLSAIELSQLRKRVEEILKEEQKRVLILMDDIDRLDKGEVHATLKLVKLSADFAYTSYILAFDEEVVAASVGERYGNGDIDAGRRFLEKIVQVPLHLPKIEAASLRRFTFSCIDEALKNAQVALSESEVREFVRQFTSGLESRIDTPRLAKRYGNALSFALPLLQGEVNSVDLMLVEGIRAFYPELYQAMRERPNIFLGQNLIGSGSYRQDDAKTDSRNFVDEALGTLSPRERKDIHHLLEYLFPRMATAYAKNHTPHGYDFEKVWQESKRVTSSAYYNRYFSYGVPGGDVSDVQLENFLKSLPSLNGDEILRKLSDWLEDQSATTLVQKLRANVDNVSESGATHLALSLAGIAECFPEDWGGFAFMSTFEQAALYASELLKKFPDEADRLELSGKIVTASNPLVFAISMLRWAGPRDTETTEPILSKGSIQVLFGLVAGRVENLLGGLKEPIYTDVSTEKHATAYLSVLARNRGRESTARYLVSTFEKDDANVLKFLRRYASSWTDVSTGERTVRNIDAEAFDSISSVIDSDTLLIWLQSSLGEDLTVEDSASHVIGHVGEHMSQKVVELELARQFARQAHAPRVSDSSEVDKSSS